MSKAIFRDPVLDGAADPTVIQRRGSDEWWMFYTNRRATHEGSGFEWIHGSPIGVAVSSDAGLSWDYRGTVAGLDDPADPGLNTHWAPEVIWGLGEYHMYLSYITGTPGDWNRVRTIVHFTSPDLMSWTRIGPLALSSGNVIDAAVALCPDGLYRLWHKDEADGSSTQCATSTDLYHWTNVGRVIPGKPDGIPHEGPNVFQLGGWYWMIVDEWHGQAAYRSGDAVTWTHQGLILDKPGASPDDIRFARHADVVTQGDWAALYYFTHPEWDEAPDTAPLSYATRRTTIHAARLTVADGVLIAERDVGPLRLDASLSQT
jgi:hypothetical protein